MAKAFGNPVKLDASSQFRGVIPRGDAPKG